MPFDANLGLIMDGKQLLRLPPNASKDEQTAAINTVIDTLNNVNKDIVGSGSVTFPIDTTGVGFTGSQTDLLTVAHNLGYKPRVFAYMNNITLTIGTTAYRHVDIPLPTYLSSAVATGFGGGPGASVPVYFYTWLDCFVDSTNVYFLHRSGSPNININLPITYSLTREASN